MDFFAKIFTQFKLPYFRLVDLSFLLTHSSSPLPSLLFFPPFPLSFHLPHSLSLSISLYLSLSLSLSPFPALSALGSVDLGGGRAKGGRGAGGPGAERLLAKAKSLDLLPREIEIARLLLDSLRGVSSRFGAGNPPF